MMGHHLLPSIRHRATGLLTLVGALLLLAGPARAVPPNELPPPGWDNQAAHWYGPWMTGDNEFYMHASDQGLFILQTWFAAAFGQCSLDFDLDTAWMGFYTSPTYPFPPGFPNPDNGSTSAGLFCHTGTFSFDFNVNNQNLWDEVTYHPTTWGQTVGGTPWAYGGGAPETLFWSDGLTGTPIMYTQDAAENPALGDNEGWMFFWPSNGLTGSWKDGMYLIPQSYYCVQPNGHSCMKDILTYINEGYWVRGYYMVVDGLDSNWSWDGETDINGPINDFNLVWVPGTGQPLQSYIILSYEDENECACDIDARWHDTGEDPPEGFPPSDCDESLANFNDWSDYPLAFLRAMDMCSDIDKISNLSVSHHGFSSGNINAATGTTNGGSIGVRSDYGSALTPRRGPRMAMINSGAVGDSSNTEGGGAWWDYSADTWHYDYALPPESRTGEAAECCHWSDPRYDTTTLEFDLTVPETAEGASYDFLVVSAEFPEYVNSVFNDGVEIVVETQRAVEWETDPNYPGYTCDTDGDGIQEGNVAFDDNGTPLRINNEFFTQWDCNWFAGVIGHNGSNNPEVHHYSTCQTRYSNCDSGVYHCWDYIDYDHDWCWTGCCPNAGDGTNSGGTGWLTNAFPLEPGETIHMRFTVYDRYDGIFDTFILLDNWRWLGEDPGPPHIYRPPSDVYLGSDLADSDGDGYSLLSGDCNDYDPNVHPGATEVCDGLDTDCDGSMGPGEIDTDQDSHYACLDPSSPFYDCDDNEPTTNASAPELCYDGVDNDCDGLVDTNDDECVGCDDFDNDGYGDPGDPMCPNGAARDCDNYNALIYPNSPHWAGWNRDADCDGWGIFDEETFDTWNGGGTGMTTTSNYYYWYWPFYWYWGYGQSWSCVSGRCWQWYDGSDYIGAFGSYNDNGNRFLWIPLDFTGCDHGSQYQVRWMQRYGFEYYYDGGILFGDPDGDGTASYFTPSPGYDSYISSIGLDGFSGSNGAWEQEIWSFSNLGSNQVWMMFDPETDYSVHGYGGWAIDEIELWAADLDQDSYVGPGDPDDNNSNVP